MIRDFVLVKITIIKLNVGVILESETPIYYWIRRDASLNSPDRMGNVFGLGEGGDLYHKCWCGEPNFD